MSTPRIRNETERHALREALTRGSFTAHELSAKIGIPERDVAGHLAHLGRTAKAEGASLRMEPPRCRDCGFAFEKRERLGRPSRCPMCRSNHIVPPRFTFVEG